MKNLKRVSLSLVLVLLMAAISGAAFAGEIVLTPDEGSGSPAESIGQTIVIDLVPPVEVLGSEEGDEDELPHVSNDLNLSDLEGSGEGDPVQEIPSEVEAVPEGEPSSENATPAKSVKISANVEGIVAVGDEITLFAVIEGYGDELVDQIWEYNDGTEWKVAQTGGLSYTFILDEVNYRWDWRLSLIVSE